MRAFSSPFRPCFKASVKELDCLLRRPSPARASTGSWASPRGSAISELTLEPASVTGSGIRMVAAAAAAEAAAENEVRLTRTDNKQLIE